MKPMLAESIAPDDLTEYVSDPLWAIEQKFDGQRFLVVVKDGQVQPFNRGGASKSTNVKLSVLGEFQTGFPTGEWIFDGELVGGRLHLFDLPQAGALVTPESPFRDRRRALELLFEEWQPNPRLIELVPSPTAQHAKQLLIEGARESQAEGVMLKSLDGRYYAGKRTSRMLKAKFVHDLDAIICGLNIKGKDNAAICLLDPVNRRIVPGPTEEPWTVSTIGKRPAPQIGDVWEIRYLYFTGEKLYQPRLVRKRTDKPAHECTIDQCAVTDKKFVYRTREAM